MPDDHSRAGCETLAEILSRHVGGRKQIDVARNAGLPRATLNRWLRSASDAPYHREGLLRLLAALQLSRAQASRALRAAGLPTIDALAADPELSALVARWRVRAPNNLPADLTSFIGREDEVTNLAEQLSDPAVRLVALTGAGGSGKTRLSLRVARELFDVFTDGVTFVALANVRDPGQVLPAIGAALGLAETAGASPAVRVTAWLAPRHALLVLDNLEQVIDCGPALAALLRSAPRLTILATSRVPLAISGEHRWPVRPFAVPSPDLPFEKLASSPAVELFTQRARAADPAFTLTAATAPDMAALCARLDGLPLAIELVAARIGDFSLPDLVATVPDPLDLASDGPRDVALRHRALRETIAWSERLLPITAQQLFASLGVLHGFDESLAAGVGKGPSVAAEAIPDLLATLADASLIERVGDDSAPHYRMLATIREYALERLDALGEHEAAAARHASAMLALAEDAPPYVPKATRAGWFQHIDRERANIDAALDWAQSTGDSLLLARLASALWPYWLEYPLGRIGYHWVTTALEHADDLPARVRAELLTGASHFELTFNSHDLAYAHATEALALWQKINDPVGQAHIFATLGWARATTDGPREAFTMFQWQLEQWQAADNELGIAAALNDIVMLLIAIGEFDTALPYLRQQREIAQRTGDPLSQSHALHNIGLHALLRGDIPTALRELGEAVTTLEALRPTFLTTTSKLYLATAQCLAGQLDTAEAGYRELLKLHERTGDHWQQSLAILGHAAVAHRRGQAERAAWLCGVASTLQHDSGLTPMPAVQAFYERETQLVVDQIGPDAFAAAFARGAAVPASEALAAVRAR